MSKIVRLGLLGQPKHQIGIQVREWILRTSFQVQETWASKIYKDC